MRIIRVIHIVLLFMTVGSGVAYASHIVGGDMTYKFVDSGVSGNRYELTMIIYEDCINANPGTIASDTTAVFTVFDAVTNAQIEVKQVDFMSTLSVPTNFSNSCVANAPSVCLVKTTYLTDFILPPSPTGYIIAYQKCCRNINIINIVNPGGGGPTYYCVIPPTTLAPHNTSAIFKNFPPQIICLNNPLVYDNSATDADGDSLSYEFCNALVVIGEPPPSLYPPPYDSVTWYYPIYNYNTPITGFPPIRLDPVTGLLTGTPNRVGRYLVTVCCHEWRNGIMINTVKREFQFVITDCSKVVIADMPQFSTQPNTYVLDCNDYTVHFINTSKGGNTYLWDFGALAQNAMINDFEPTFTYPDTGIYTVKLVVNPGGTCQDSITKLVKIYHVFHAAFIDTGNYCPGAQINFLDNSIVTIKPVTFWQWNFGDGGTSVEQNPWHTYQYGGTYNVVLTSQNIKGCTDTALNHVVVDNFHPFAGDDTVIVKGESIQFSAQGGEKYSWWPDERLSSSNSSGPIGYYPDTGHFAYTVRIESAYGCTGEAFINVKVVDNASFFVPNAFSPNGDGLNDVFRPRAVGYRSLKYFKVYNRFGEEIYTSESLEEGWDGTYNHHHADVGTYFWMITYTDRFGKDGFLKGDVTLVR